MARGSGSSGGYSYRQWEAAERARQRELDRKRKEAEKARAAAEAQARDDEASAKTSEVEARVVDLGTLLRSSLSRDPRIAFDSMRRTLTVPPLNLGPLATPVPAPRWEDFEPEPPNIMQRAFGGARRHQSSYAAAEEAFVQAQQAHQAQEADRRRGAAVARTAWEENTAALKHEIDAHNAHIDELATGFDARDRFAVSEYLQAVLDASPYPEGFPTERHVGYVPESELVAVEWFLPTFDIVPEHKAFRHVKQRKSVEPVARPFAEAQRIYNKIIAQVAVRTVREVFAAVPVGMVSTVIFNGHVETVNPATGRVIRPPLISVRATKEKFEELVLSEPRFDPVTSIKRHFSATISPHPEELTAIEPVMPFSRADPRVVEAIDVISSLDQRPNLLDLTPREFESFIQNLFTKMGYETDRFRDTKDGGIDCMAYKRDPVAPMKIAVQAKLYTKTVRPTSVRDLFGTMQHEGATHGIMITTSGYGPGSEAFANGKPLHLIDGHGLISICQEHGIPARILGIGTRKSR